MSAIFIAVGLGALTVTLLHDPMALIPHPPYGRWIIVRLLVLSSLAQAHQIPPHIVEAVRYRHSVLRDPGFSDRREYAQHQMFGRGRVIQVAADDMAHEHILLLQLSPDDAIGWNLGDAGALQYWIRPADLAAQRFENTVLTFESH